MSISDYLINVSKASQFIRTKGYDLEETVKSLQSSGKVIPLANRTMTIPASLSRRLAVGDKVSSDLDKSVKSLLDLAQAASEYDKECKTALEEERKALGDYLTGGKFETAVKVFQGGSFDSVMTTGAKFFKGEQTYPGNVMFTLRKLAVSIGSISVPTHDFQKINLSDKHAEEEKKISTPSLETLHELAKVCQEVDKIAQHMKDEARVLNTQVDKMFANVFGAEGDNESLPAEFRALMSLYKRRAVALNKTSSLIVGHLVTTARAALAVAAMAVKEYETIG